MKEEGGTWRHELKYVCSEAELTLIRERIRPVMRPDPHAGADGMYCIRSVYFDDEWDSGARENEDGTDPREKFRIRIYNGSDSKITLELKQKMRGMTRKLSCPLTRAQCEDAISGRIPVLGQEQLPDVYRKFILQQKTRNLKARVIVEYARMPWVYASGNVRVTFDRTSVSGADVEAFLEQDFARRPIMPAGQHVLEVKYDDFLPDPIRQVLQTGMLRRTAFSKYYLCRKYGIRFFS